MNVDKLFEERSTLRESLRRFLANELGDVSGLIGHRSSIATRRQAWGRLANQGWLSDRSETGTLDLVAMHEEFGRQCVFLPFVGFNFAVTAIEMEIARGSTSAPTLLADMKRGRRVLLPTQVAISRSSTPERTVVRGVLGASLATDLLIDDPESLALVSADAAGVTLKSMNTNSGLDVSLVTWDASSPRNRLAPDQPGSAAHAIAVATALSQVLLSAEMMGNASEIVDMTSSYAKERVQFGRPIGSFQAIQHKLAEMLLARDSTFELVRRAAVVLDQNPAAFHSAAIAKLAANSAARRIAFEAHQVFAGVGFMLEHRLHTHTFALAIHEQVLGSTEFLRQNAHLVQDTA